MAYSSSQSSDSQTGSPSSEYSTSSEGNLDLAQLTCAIDGNDVEQVELLLGSGIQLSPSDYWLLWLGCLRGKRMASALLRNRSLDLNHPILGEEDRILHYVLRTPEHKFENGEKGEVIQVLLDSGASPTEKDRLGDTALHVTCAKGEDALLLRLLSVPGSLASINDKNKFENTPLIIAALNDYPRCAQALLDHGADAAIVGEFNKSPLAIARERQGATEAVLLGAHASNE